MRRSLIADLVRYAAAALFLAGAVGVGLWSVFVHYEPAWAYRQGLLQSIDRLQKSLTHDAEGRPVVTDLDQQHQTMYQVLQQDMIYQIVSDSGAVLLTSGPDPTPLIESKVDLAEGRVINIVRNGVPMHVLSEAVKGARAGGEFVVVARSQRFEQMALGVSSSRAWQSAVFATVLAMAIFTVVVIVIVNRLLQRLSETSAAAALIAPTNLTARLEVEGVPREVVPLIESFNAALERLEIGFRNQQEFLATAAHELKTPIALIRAQVELDGARDSAGILADIEHMSRHVHQLLHLAEVSDVASMAPASTDAGAVVEDALRTLQRMTAARSLTVNVDDGGMPTIVEADASGLFILVRNLLENAVHHSPPGGTITVTLSSELLVVLDDGPGIAPDDLPLLFKRFWRGAHRRDDGAGLGLAICQEIARAHGWSIVAGNRSSGGASFAVHFRQR